MDGERTLPADRPLKQDKTNAAALRRRLLLWAEGIVLLALVPLSAFLLLYKDVRPIVIYEFDGGCPPVSAFARGDASGEFVTAAESMDWSKPCWRLLQVNGGSGPRLTLAVAADTQAPRGEAVATMIGVDETIGADRMVTNLSDKQLIGVSFVKTPPFGEVGEYAVKIRLKDLSGNETILETTLTILRALPSLTVEAGGPLPTAEDFLPNQTLQCAFLSDISDFSTKTVGVYPIQLLVNGSEVDSSLVVEDTVAPVITVRNLSVKTGGSVAPEDFAAVVQDETELTWRFITAPDTSVPGYQKVLIAAKDQGGNETEAEAELLVSPFAPVTVEASQDYLTAQALSIAGEGELACAFIPNTPGVYDLPVSTASGVYSMRITVEDTQPPQAVLKTLTGYVGHSFTAEDFIESLSDAGKASCAFEGAVDFETPGEQTVTIRCTDQQGNFALYKTTLNLLIDTEPPVLYNVVDRFCYIGEAVSYFSSILGEDNTGDPVEITVDNSAVNIYAAGKYPIVYIAKDPSGNESRYACSLTFIEQSVSDDDLNAAVDAVLTKIITPDMSLAEKGYAVFCYVHDNVRYKAASNKQDYKYEAWRGLTTHKGDCFTFCSTARVLLEKIGAQVMVVTRYGGYKNTRHWWLLVNLGTGWYHFDVINVGPKNYECFMRTDAEIKKRSAGFWSFDTRLYPATPQEPFEMN